MYIREILLNPQVAVTNLVQRAAGAQKSHRTVGAGIVIGKENGGKSHIQHAPHNAVGPGPAGDVRDEYLHSHFLKLPCLPVNLLRRPGCRLKGM